MAQDDGAIALATRFERLFQLTPETMAYSESSYDRRGLNVDLPNPGLGNPYPTYLGNDSHGDRVLLDVKGAGCVYRIFMSEFSHRTTARLKVYLDGSATPAINEKVIDLSEGRVPGFPAPLVHIRNQAGSGGPATCQHNDVPIPFARSIRITTDESGADLYQNIQYHLFAAGTPVRSWTPDQDLSATLAQLNRTGHDPKTQTGNLIRSGTAELPADSRLTLFEAKGPRQIQSIKIRIAGLSQWNGEALSHAGRSFAGSCSFHAAVFPRNDGIKLKRLRLVKPGVAGAARVFIDDLEVGQWIDRPEQGIQSREPYWSESEFFIPGKFTRGKSTLAVRIENARDGGSWSDYRYRIHCAHVDHTLFDKDKDAIDKLTKGCGYRLSDVLEIGDKESEAGHHYACTREIWRGITASRFPVRDTHHYRSYLNDIRLKITWDGATTPAVDACLSGFFAQSRFGMDEIDHSVAARTLPVGIDEDDFLYCYFPMPFQQRAQVELIAGHLPAAARLEYEIQDHDFAGSFGNVGYFKAHELHSDKSEKDTSNFTLLEVQGTGKVVGVTSNMEQTKLNVTGQASFLEGDERIYVDGSKTAAICGSGKEDFHGGSYYFWGGPYTLPTSGCSYNSKWGFNSHPGSTHPYRCSAYRFMIQDAVPFRSGVRFDIEHGSHMNYPGWPGEEKDAPNHDQETAYYLTFYYHRDAAAMVLSDALEVADATSQAAHHYDPNGKTPIAKTGNWDRNGYYDQATHTHAGMVLAATNESTFTASIDPHNRGVMLRRLMWHAHANQAAEVRVDDRLVGVWQDGGKNFQNETDLKPMLWRETACFLPADFTRGKSAITVKLKITSPLWNEFKYEIFTLNEPVAANPPPP